jgi:hypothetical protein
MPCELPSDKNGAKKRGYYFRSKKYFIQSDNYVEEEKTSSGSESVQRIH